MPKRKYYGHDDVQIFTKFQWSANQKVKRLCSKAEEKNKLILLSFH